MKIYKNILIVVASLTEGGAERVSAEWATLLAASGHKVSILTDMSRPITFSPAAGVKIHDFGLSVKARWWTFSRFISRVNVLLKLFKVISTEKTDVVIDVGHQYGLEVLAATRIFRIKALQTDHNACTRPDDMPMAFRDKYRKFIQSRLFDGITVLTRADYREMQRRRVTRAYVLFNPLSLPPYKRNNDLRKTILAIGRTDAWKIKGFDILISAWKKLWSRYPDWNLRIIGSGSEKSSDYLRKVAEECPTIEFVPFQDNIVAEYRNADIFVLSSRCEGWGLVAVEAMSQGCAVVACDFEGRQSEYIDNNVTGILCKPGNADVLADKIESLITNDALRLRLQCNAPQIAERFSPKLIGHSLEKIIYRICGDRES